MKNKIIKTLSVVGLALSTSFAFGWDVYEQAKNGNVLRLQWTIPMYCPGGTYYNADDLQGALLVVEDYLNAFRAGSKLNERNLIYKYCHDENNMAGTLDGVWEVYENIKKIFRTCYPYETEDSRRGMDVLFEEFSTYSPWGGSVNFSKWKNLQLLRKECAVDETWDLANRVASATYIEPARGKKRQELARIIYDIEEYLSNLELDESRFQQEGSHEFTINYHSKDNLKSRIKDAIKLREVAKNGLKKLGYE